MNLPALHAAVAQVCPLVAGVSVSDTNDRSTWVVQYDGKPSADQLAAVTAVIAAYSAGPDKTDVDVERDRRIALGFSLSMSDGSTIPVQTRNAVDFRNLSGLSDSAIALKVEGQVPTTIVFHDAVDQNHNLAPDLVVEMGLKIVAAVQAIYAKSWVLKAMSPIPKDYADDSHWQ